MIRLTDGLSLYFDKYNQFYLFAMELTLNIQALLCVGAQVGTVLYWEIPRPKSSSWQLSVCRSCGGSAMDAGRLEQQVASVDRGITFLKQEHLAMLTGLQLEITHLKRRCHGQSTGDLLPLNHSSACLSVTLSYLFLSVPPPTPPLAAELSCELDSRFPDRNTEGKTLQLLADKGENDTWEILCHGYREESAVQRRTGNSQGPHDRRGYNDMARYNIITVN